MNQQSEAASLVVKPDDGRVYPMGRMSAVFKADLEETRSALSVSEWWLEPNTEGPHIHQHPEAHLYYVIDGVLAVYLEDQGWLEAVKGTYVYIPGNMEHGFENRGDKTVGFMAINNPGGFEQSLPFIVDYFAENPLGDAQTDV